MDLKRNFSVFAVIPYKLTFWPLHGGGCLIPGSIGAPVSRWLPLQGCFPAWRGQASKLSSRFHPDDHGYVFCLGRMLHVRFMKVVVGFATRQRFAVDGATQLFSTAHCH